VIGPSYIRCIPNAAAQVQWGVDLRHPGGQNDRQD
jgi:hypothetical protein